jgi:hydrogenase maturation protease
MRCGEIEERAMASLQRRRDGESSSVVVIGYGNTLRHDDAVGCLVADAVHDRASPQVRAISAFQLTPELAAELAAARLAIFVDARAGSSASGVLSEEIGPMVEGSPSLVHAITPRFLLGLSLAIFGCCPRSWSVSVPCHDFSFGEGLSSAAEQGRRDALGVIGGLIDQMSDPEPEPDLSLPCPIPVDRNGTPTLYPGSCP